MMCQFLSSCHIQTSLFVAGGSSLVLVVGLLSSCVRVFSNCERIEYSLVVLRRGSFSICDVQDVTL